MSIFQKSVINNHLSQLDSEQVDKAFEKFNENYSNSKIAKIQKMKEEEYQDGFLRDIFENVLDYTLKPADNHNLEREFKNQNDGKKADGAILKDEKAVVVIELKSTKTKDLTNVTQQAFNYKNNQPDCKYVITSNFHKLRFYIDYANEYEEFDLFNLQREDFQLFYLLLHKDSIFSDLPSTLKTETKFHEEDISDKLYKDYSSFKHKIYHNLVDNNPQYDKLTLFKKSQKFLDRLLFVFFAEDTGLVPANAISKIVEQWEQLQDLDAYQPLYSRFKIFFGHLNKGHKYKTYDLPAYNGGLFAPDEILDNITIDDEVLKDDALLLSAYDYSTEVDVNILGHIFEHSLNEIEEITAEIEGTAQDKTKSKRKKDGVFYTPKYITQYIVENTIGKLCSDKREELDIVEIEFDNSIVNKSGKVSAKGKKLFDKLQAYKDWLFDLKIVDPACGSGAFLNQALNFLIAEHHQIDDIIAELTGEKIRLFDTDKTILERNLYGVDINDESVEIAKLSLWLRTAQKGRKLSNLNNNIKCGNSLIDDPEVAGEKAFNWQNEFPEIFANGGFDVVIGNPPYVRQELLKEYYEVLKNYEVFSGKADLFTYFYEKGLNILKSNGYLSFISSGKFLEASYGKTLISFLLDNSQFVDIINFDDLEVFKGVSAYPLIFTAIKKEKSIINDYDFNYCYIPEHDFISLEEIVTNVPFAQIKIKDFIENEYKFFDKNITSILKKINSNSIFLKDLKCLPLVGVKTGYNDGFTNSEKTITINKPYIFGKNLKKYSIPFSETDIIFPYTNENEEYRLIKEPELCNAIEYINSKRAQLEKRAIIKDGIKNGSKCWYEYQQINKKLNFDSEYIVYPNVSLGTNFTLSKGNVIDMTGFIIPSNDKYLLTVLNSSICNFVMRKTAITRRGGYQEYKVQYLEKIPIKELQESNKTPFIEKADQMLSLNKELQEKVSRFLNRIKSNFEIEKISKKLEAFYDYDFKTFVAELKKQKIKLTLSQQDEWDEYFEVYKSEINALQSQISVTDNEIDQMVYELYGLSVEEIKIVEESI